MTASAVTPTLEAPGHPRDLLAWHGLAAVAMAAMLLDLTPGWLVRAATAAFAVGAVWCVVRAVRTASPGPFLRLGVCCVAMVVMLVPLLALGSGAAHPAGGHAGHDLATSAGPGSAISATSALTAVVVVALVVVLALGVRRLAVRRTPWRHRTGAGLEAVLAGSMVAMLLAAH